MRDDTQEQTGGDLNAQIVEGVFDLARQGATGQLGEMIDAGVSIDIRNGRGDTLLIVAAYQQHADTVAELIRRGADVDVVNGVGQTAIACAVFRGNEALLRALLTAGADPERGTPTGVQIADQFGMPHMRAVIESHRTGV
jgi:ankyrin repeat protein